MSNPIIFVSNQRIKEGKFAEYSQLYRQVAGMTEASKPGTAAHLAYANEDGSQVSIIHIFPDVEAMEAHMHGVDELAKKASEYMEIAGFEIYGEPGEKILERMMQAAGGQIPLHIKPLTVGGYIRLKSV